jgi:hypothetical protein
MEKYSLPEMKMRDIVLGIIFLKEGSRAFDETDLKLGLKRCTSEYPDFERLFRERYAGGPEKTDDYSCILISSEMGFLLEPGDLSMPYIHMGEYGRKYVEKDLKASYGEEIFDRLKPVADAVWKAAYDKCL